MILRRLLRRELAAYTVEAEHQRLHTTLAGGLEASIKLHRKTGLETYLDRAQEIIEVHRHEELARMGQTWRERVTGNGSEREVNPWSETRS